MADGFSLRMAGCVVAPSGHVHRAAHYNHQSLPANSAVTVAPGPTRRRQPPYFRTRRGASRTVRYSRIDLTGSLYAVQAYTDRTVK